jgi:hypothetical protein
MGIYDNVVNLIAVPGYWTNFKFEIFNLKSILKILI